MTKVLSNTITTNLEGEALGGFGSQSCKWCHYTLVWCPYTSGKIPGERGVGQISLKDTLAQCKSILLQDVSSSLFPGF